MDRLGTSRTRGRHTDVRALIGARIGDAMVPKRGSSADSHVRSNDLSDDVWPGDEHEEPLEMDDRQSRERLAEYFALLREWDLKLRRKASDAASS